MALEGGDTPLTFHSVLMTFPDNEIQYFKISHHQIHRLISIQMTLDFRQT